MKKSLIIIIIGIILSLSLVISRGSYDQYVPDNSEVIEIREYEGKDLSSINAFRENSIKGPQYIDEDNYQLQITGLVERNTNYTYNEVVTLHDLYKKVVTLYCVEGWDVTILWEGILLKDILYEAGINSNVNTVIFHAYDGYTTSLPLNYIVENDIMLAHKMNGINLPPERGFPFQLVAESKYGYKWIKWITTIELSNNEDYEGYWESRGYPNNAYIGSLFP